MDHWDEQFERCSANRPRATRSRRRAASCSRRARDGAFGRAVRLARAKAPLKSVTGAFVFTHCAPKLPARAFAAVSSSADKRRLWSAPLFRGGTQRRSASLRHSLLRAASRLTLDTGNFRDQRTPLN
ncbi:hypothetical protein SKAU_G00128340 [Synaphobranchus kaupii]|uniref:Uncharacterized protein n=1 Tax=Synaphobranchus kaupii TaxID=118154 RepID=A0A9Q1FQ22_SYNKA|nr:hypothetical protein SKAU_G00128340 [Synaphobranchus kaupii]